MRSALTTLTALGALILLAATPGYGLEIVLHDGCDSAMTAEQRAAFELAADFWEAEFRDPITVEVNIGLKTYSDPGILGSSLAQRTTHDYSTVRAALLDRWAAYDLPVASLPVTDFNGHRDDDTVTMTTANAKALGLGTAADPIYGIVLENNADARICFNIDRVDEYDYDRTDGIDPDKHDFVGVALHELAHALGFTSMTDVQDDNTGLTLHPSPLDFWRFNETGGPHGVGTERRRITHGPAEYYDGIPWYSNIPMSHGTGEFDPDCGCCGRPCQAAHWCDTTGYLMDPTLPEGVQDEVTSQDIHALVHVGYERVIPPGTVLAPPLCVLVGFCRLDPGEPLPDFGGAFEKFGPPPDPQGVQPPFEPEFAARIGLDFGEGLQNRGGTGFVQFEDQRPYKGPTIKGLPWGLFVDDINEEPPRDPMENVPPTVMDFYFESDSQGIPFRARMLGGQHGVQYDPSLGKFGGYRIPLALDGLGDEVQGDIDAIATLIMLADQLKIPDPDAQNIFQMGLDGFDNSLVVYDAVALGVPEPNQWALTHSGLYNNAANWTDNSVPKGVDAVANFLGRITGLSTVTVGEPVTVGTINFANTNRYTLAGPAEIRLETSAGDAQIIVMEGWPVILSPLSAARGLTVYTAGGASLTLQPSNLSVLAGDLTKNGPGTLMVATRLLLAGDVYVDEGLLRVGHDLLAYAESPKVLVLSGGTRLQASGVVNRLVYGGLDTTITPAGNLLIGDVAGGGGYTYGGQVETGPYTVTLVEFSFPKKDATGTVVEGGAKIPGAVLGGGELGSTNGIHLLGVDFGNMEKTMLKGQGTVHGWFAAGDPVGGLGWIEPGDGNKITFTGNLQGSYAIVGDVEVLGLEIPSWSPGPSYNFKRPMIAALMLNVAGSQMPYIPLEVDPGAAPIETDPEKGYSVAFVSGGNPATGETLLNGLITMRLDPDEVAAGNPYEFQRGDRFYLVWSGPSLLSGQHLEPAVLKYGPSFGLDVPDVTSLGLEWNEPELTEQYVMVSIVPEPSTLLLLATGGLALLLVWRRRRRS